MFGIFLLDDMDPFYENLTSFPTVVFSLALIVVVLYWLVAVLGMVDIEALDIDGVEPDSGAEPNVLAGLLMRFGLGGVPVVVSLSFVALFGWIISYYLVHFLMPFVPGGVLRFVAGLPVLAISGYCALRLAALVVRPMRRLFAKASQKTIKRVLGQTATIRTPHVDSRSGQALLKHHGADLIFQVRTIGDARIERGEPVVLLEYIAEEHAYRVMTEAEFNGESQPN